MVLESVAARDQIRAALATAGFEARFPDEPPAPRPLTSEEKANLDIKVASRGEAIRIEDHLAPGKITVFDYYADWCPPCHLLTPKLERLLLKYDNLALRMVDVSNLDSEAVKQATREVKVLGLPYVKVFGPDGELLGAVQGNHVEKVEKLLNKAQAR